VLAVLQQLSVLSRTLLGAWLLTMISFPIVERRWGDAAKTRAVTAGVLLQAATVIAVVLPKWGPSTTPRVALTVVFLGWSAEFLGSHTGFPFGRYSYTPKLQPQVGEVPLLIPLAWLMMLPPAWAIGGAIAPAQNKALFILVSTLAFTAWDLFLDPQMVAWGLWIWRAQGQTSGSGYFGIPWTNYLGWLLVSGLITWIVLPGGLPPDTPVAALILIYGLTWGLETFGQLVFWRLRGPASVGAMVMGAFLLLAALGSL
jgi:uncharacterized membrane protein